jgi:hypothetical protein
MAEHIPDLWPADFGPVKVTPVAILREQAEFLTRKTEGALRGAVNTTGAPDVGFLHTFLIQVPSLGGYTYGLFTVQHGLSFYPAKILSSPVPGDLVASTEAEFMDRLRQVFSAAATQELINALLSQARAGAA